MLIELAVIVVLTLALTVSVGINIVSLSTLRIVRNDLPQMAFEVGSALIDQKAKQFLGDVTEGSKSGRPQEGIMGFLMQFINTPKGQEILGGFLGGSSKSAGGSTFGT